MNRRCTILLSAAVGFVLLLATRIRILDGRIADLKTQNAELTALRAERIERNSDAERNSKVLQAEIERFKADQQELLRLRGEIAALRRHSPNPVRAGPGGVTAEVATQAEDTVPLEADLNEEQAKLLQTITEEMVSTTDSKDLDRLRDSLNRWDELVLESAPVEMKPVFEILKGRVKERIRDLESR
ncbi:MAG: hypothetical protein JNL10_11760 [Verrucomicrobiales bacterium]|nr:hypothetical protein [Verrucomicrobiales bacterium]